MHVCEHNWVKRVGVKKADQRKMNELKVDLV